MIDVSMYMIYYIFLILSTKYSIIVGDILNLGHKSIYIMMAFHLLHYESYFVMTIILPHMELQINTNSDNFSNNFIIFAQYIASLFSINFNMFHIYVIFNTIQKARSTIIISIFMPKFFYT